LTELPTGASATYKYASELASSTSGSTTTDYAYNADGERLSQKQGSTTTMTGTWNGADELTTYDVSAADMSAATYDGNGLRASDTINSDPQQFVWNVNTTIPELLMDSTNAYIYGSDEIPVEQVNLSTGVISYLVADAVGSVRGIVNSAGGLTATTSYAAWGNPLTSGGLTSYTPFGFAGGYTDATGLLYLQNRYYDPQTGAFLTVDPEVSQTSEPYCYAGDDPVSFSDPDGLERGLSASLPRIFGGAVRG
jgi:RHS repeat-associated protein